MDFSLKSRKNISEIQQLLQRRRAGSLMNGFWPVIEYHHNTHIKHDWHETIILFYIFTHIPQYTSQGVCARQWSVYKLSCPTINIFIMCVLCIHYTGCASPSTIPPSICYILSYTYKLQPDLYVQILPKLWN